VIMLGCGGRLAVWGATTVPRDIHGTWWIAFAAEYGLDLETYRSLSLHCQSFHESDWTLDSQVRWSQHKLEVVEAEIKELRFLNFVDTVVAAGRCFKARGRCRTLRASEHRFPLSTPVLQSTVSFRTAGAAKHSFTTQLLCSRSATERSAHLYAQQKHTHMHT